MVEVVVGREESWQTASRGHASQIAHGGEALRTPGGNINRRMIGRSIDMTDSSILFQQKFKDLTGHPPLSWQTRLYRQHFAGNEMDRCPAVIDIPTGLGKTMVMAIWLIARAQHPDKVPTRLIYVVDRRTVVDQATYLALKIHGNCPQALGIEPPAISTLRGQLADNRKWSRDPSRPAIIIGTVDLIGSALLFSGYRSSYKRRPLEAGLLGQDSLLVLDEAHLSKPFERLICAIGDDGSFQKTRKGNAQGKPMRVVRMSATSGNSADSKPPFTLQFDANGNLTGEDANDSTIAGRFGAKKRLTITMLGEKDKLVDKLASAAIELVAPSNPQHTLVIGQRIVIFTRRPDDARTIAETIRKSKKGDFAKAVEVLTGTMRGLKRDELVEKPVFTERWLNGDLKPKDPANQSPVFLIATSAGEVGFDLNADHMVCDATTIDSLIQRLGRVNRRGLGDAQIHLFVEPPKKGKDDKSKKLEGLDLAIANTIDLLRGIEDVSPKNIAVLKASDAWTKKADNGRSAYENACSPEPTMVELTDILLDAWSMTSITEPMPGRPEVGPWLRGIANEQAQTTVAWRAEIELLHGTPSPEKGLQTIFVKHPIRPHESLTVNTGHLLEFLKRVPKLKDRPSDLMSTRVAVRLPRGQIVCRTLQQLSDEPGILYADSTLILPARFGGLDPSGMLDASSIPPAPKNDESEPLSLDVADHSGYEQRDDASPRLRLIIRRTDAGWKTESLPGGTPISDRLQLDEEYATSTSLFADLRKSDLRIRLVQPIELDEESDAVRSLVMLSPVTNKNKNEDQSLDTHVGEVETEARRIADALKLAKDDPVRVALLFAARWHDEGKKADVWQRFVYGSDENGQYKGKSSKSRDPRSLGGYRHEFGSLLRICHPDQYHTAGCTLPTDADTRDLALHLIATHHGASRPHFESAVYRESSTQECDAVHTESIRRFARLQRKYGWWCLAYLLRCADAMASADQDGEDDTTDTEGGEQ